MAFNCKTAIITGAAGCVASSVARELLKQGLKAAVLIDNDENAGLEVEEKLRFEFGKLKVEFLNVDVTDSKRFQEAFRYTVRNYKNLDFVINAASSKNECEWLTLANINLLGTIYGTRLGFTYISKNKLKTDGTVCNLTSIVGQVPVPTAPVFGSVSNAVIGLGKSYGTEYYYNLFKTKVITICLGLTNTPSYQEFKEFFSNAKENLPVQEPQDVAKNIALVLESCQNGLTYEIEEGKCYTLMFPRRDQMKKN